jgi:flagellar hook-length control protein FliK
LRYFTRDVPYARITVMTATISPAPNPVAQIAQVALNSSGPADVAATGAANGADNAGVGSFAALFQQFAGKQLATNLNPSQIVIPVDASAADTTVADDSLTALLPFLEAMGLLPAAARHAGTDKTEMSAEEIVDASLLAGVAPALTPQLTPAASTAAISAADAVKEGTLAGIGTEAQPHLDLQARALVAAEQASALNSAEKGALLTNEFSSRLATVLENAGDKSANTLSAAVVAQQPASANALQTAITATPVLPVEQPVGASGWGQEVGNRVVWMANRMESRAELVLTPPQMGRVEVSLSISGDQASASFVSANPQVREALEAALPRLREILADAGIQLGQAQVGAENARQSAQQEKNRDNFGFDRDTEATAGTLQAGTTTVSAAPGLKIGRGLVDVFA